jgi:chlorobactene glucosyltransferase
VDPAATPPSVSIVVPARNEALNIEACVRSLVASDYPDFEVIVVDDRSEDGTGELARALEPGNAKRVVVLDGTELPDGWLGKPWACAQGAKVATGELLLFTDADTTHRPALLERAVLGMAEDQADLLTLLGRQLMESFWERLMQPHIFLLMLLRYPDFERIAKRGHWRDALANGQFMFFRRDSYEALGGHEAVHREVVEDQALAQLVKRSGRCLSVRAAEDDFATRMYRSLSDIVEGWTKNIVLGGRASLPPVLRAVMVPGTVLGGIGLWLLPPACLVVAMLGMGGPDLLVWSAGSTGISVAIFSRFVWQMHGPPLYGLLYPLGATMTMYIVIRAAMRGSRVEWKGREYDVDRHVDGT